MWAQLAVNFNIVTPAQLSPARRDFLIYSIEEDELYLVSKPNFNDLLRLVTTQGGTVSNLDQLQTLLGSLPKKFDTIRETCFAQTPTPDIEYNKTRMFDRETTQKRREKSGVLRGEVYFQSTGRGGSVGGKSTGAARGGGGSGSGGRGADVKSENYFRCGESHQWSRKCPKKDSVCIWCGAAGHIEKTCCSKANGSTKGGKSDGGRGRRRTGRGRGGSYSRFEEGNTKEDGDEQGYSEVLIGEVNMGT